LGAREKRRIIKDVERERSVRGGSVRDEVVELVPKESERERSADGFRGARDAILNSFFLSL